MKTSTTLALALATGLLGPVAATAQTDQPAVHHHSIHHYPRHHVVHHYVARGAGPVAAPVLMAPAPQAAPFGLSLPHIAPYPDNRGDEDGLSDDENNCNKGCVGGAPD